MESNIISLVRPSDPIEDVPRLSVRDNAIAVLDQLLARSKLDDGYTQVVMALGTDDGEDLAFAVVGMTAKEALGTLKLIEVGVVEMVRGL